MMTVNNSKLSEFCSALNQRDIESITNALKDGFNPNTILPKYHTALKYAAGKNDVELCELLLSYGANVYLFDEGGNFPFRTALACESYDVSKLFIKLLIQENLDSEYFDITDINVFFSPLYSAFQEYIDSSSYQEDEYVLEAIMSVPKTWLYQPLLAWAAKYNLYMECFNLLALGADPYCLEVTEYSIDWQREFDPIEIAIKNGYKDIVMLLLAWRKSININASELNEYEKIHIRELESEALEWLNLLGKMPNKLDDAPISNLNFGINVLENEFNQQTTQQWSVGTKVSHPIFGEGSVLSYEAGNTKVQVNFYDSGIKWMAIEYAKLTEVS